MPAIPPNLISIGSPIVRLGGMVLALVGPPVEALRISPDTAAGLRELGLERITQLAVLPRDLLNARFGNGVLRRLGEALGHAHKSIV